MKEFFAGTTGLKESELVRKFGYHFYTDRNTGKRMYVKRMREQGRYPRFHMHLSPDERNGQKGALVDLHYDWRKPLHVKEAHSSESDGEVVEPEMERIREIWNKIKK